MYIDLAGETYVGLFVWMEVYWIARHHYTCHII